MSTNPRNVNGVNPELTDRVSNEDLYIAKAAGYSGKEVSDYMEATKNLYKEKNNSTDTRSYV